MKENMNHHNRNAPSALELELDCSPEDHHASLVVKMIAHLKGLVIKAMQDKAGTTERGRVLRKTATIRIYIGTTGRTMLFNAPPEEDEMRQLQAWRGVAARCLDTLSLAISFGHFLSDIEEIYTLPESEQVEAQATMVKQVRASGGLKWERERLPLKAIGKIFKDTQGNMALWHSWVQAVEAAEAAAQVEQLASVEEVALELATGLGADVGDPKPSTEELRVQTERAQKAAQDAKDRLAAQQAELARQSDRLAAVGTPNLVPETAPAVPETTAKLLASLSKEELAALVAAAQQMQEPKEGNAQA